MQAFRQLNTSQDLLDKLRRPPTHTQSPKDILEQRVSFVFGSMGQDSGVTRDQVRKVLIEQSGGVVGNGE